MHNLSFTICSGKATRTSPTFRNLISQVAAKRRKRRAPIYANIKDAVRGFLEAAEDNKGILDEILEEAGYQRIGAEWKGPEFVGIDRVTMNL